MHWALIDELLLGIITQVPVRRAAHGPEASCELLQVTQGAATVIILTALKEVKETSPAGHPDRHT